MANSDLADVWARSLDGLADLQIQPHQRAWLKLTRAGNTITAYSSANGTTWTQVGTTTIAMSDPVTVGLFVCAHNAGALNTSKFDNVSISSP